MHEPLLEQNPDQGYWLYGEQVRTFIGGPFDRTFWYDCQELARACVEQDIGPRGPYRDRDDGLGVSARLVRRWVGALEVVS